MLPPRRSQSTSKWVDKGAGSGRGRVCKYRPPPTHLLPLLSCARSSVQPHAQESSAPSSPRQAPVLCFLFLSPPFPLPLSLSPPPGYCAVLRAHTLSGASAQNSEAAARPAASSAATPRCPSAPRPRGSPLGAAAAAARGCPSRGPALAAAPRIAALRKGRRGKEPGAAIDTALGPLKGAARAD